VIVRIQHSLNHADENDIVGWIHPKPGSRRAIPEERSLAVRHASFRRIEDYGAIEAIPKARPHDVLPDPEFSRKKICRQMIRGHQLNRGGGQDALVSEFAAISEHLREAIIVLSRGDQAPPPEGAVGCAA